LASFAAVARTAESEAQPAIDPSVLAGWALPLCDAAATSLAHEAATGDPAVSVVVAGRLGVMPRVFVRETATIGPRPGAPLGSGVTGAPDARGNGATDGSTDGDASGCAEAGGALVGLGGALVGRGPPGVDVARGFVGEVVAVGWGETKAVTGVGPPAVVGGVSIPEIPNPSATVARIRLITPNVRTSRRRCAAVKSARSSWCGRPACDPLPRGRW
jgi:hypothetical protein